MPNENPASAKAILDLVCSMERARQERKADFDFTDEATVIKISTQLIDEIHALCNKYTLEYAMPFPDIINCLTSTIAEDLAHHFYNGDDLLPVSLACADTTKALMEKVGIATSIERQKRSNKS